MAAEVDLTVTRGLLSRMVDAITSADSVQLQWSATDLADLAAEVYADPDLGRTRVWALS